MNFVLTSFASLMLASTAPAPEAPPADVTAHAGEGPSVALGVGHAYGFFGVRGEWRFEHLSLGLGVGTFFPLAALRPDISVAPGARWYFNDASHSSLFVGAHANLNFVQSGFVAAVVVGYRLQWSHVFIEASVGPAVSAEYLADRGDRVPPGIVVTFGALGSSLPFFPDIGVALGVRF